jgi:3-dehydroquinate synthase
MITSPISVALGDRSYEIHIGRRLLGQAGTLIKPLLATPKVFVVTDENVARLHLEALAASLDAAGIEHAYAILPPGEATKNFAELERLLDAMLAARSERGTPIVAFGGGVVGDLAGFAASVLLRGVPLVQMPTTLLAQVDSSVGGKTGINTRRGKNLIGSFHQPRLVLADVDVLATLPEREVKSGYAEIVKYGLIDDPGLFAWLEANGARLLAGDADRRASAVLACCQAKARIVGIDEREAGGRTLLNLGHTFAHALEAEAGYGIRLTHGEAVSIGLVLAFDLSTRLGLCPPADLARLVAHFEALTMPVRLPALDGRRWEAERLVEHLASDKKVRDGRVTFVLAKGIGRSFLCREVPPAAVRAVFEDAVRAAVEGEAT